MKRAKKVLGCLLLLLIIFFIIPIPINKSYPAKEIQIGNPDSMVDCQVDIKGYYNFNIFTKDTFKGQIKISDYPLTGKNMRDLNLSYGQDDSEYIEYTYEEGYDKEGKPITMKYIFGFINTDRLFKNMCIMVFDENVKDKSSGAFPRLTGGFSKSWAAEGGYCIVPFAETYDEAMEIVHKRTGYDFEIK